jgi:hypothetical protein
VISVLVVNPGSNYRVTPRVVFDGGNGTLARAYAVMTNDVVRQFRTVIKYDRYQYNTNIETWSPDGTYVNGTLVRYDDRVWRAVSDDSSAVVGPDFDLANWQLVPAAELSGVNRTMGYYVPGVNEPGLDIHQLIGGTSYPGVQVWGDYFLGSDPTPLTVVCTSSSSTTNAVTCSSTLRLTVDGPIRFFGSTFGGIVAGVVYYVRAILSPTEFTLSTVVGGSTLGLTTGSGNMVAWIPEPIDATYASSFTDQFLGLRPTDINVDGGEFIGPYEGYAPEELVNGAEFDTVDIRVYTRPGSDWTDDGHGFEFKTINYTYDPAAPNTYSWAGVIENPVQVRVFNATTGIDSIETQNYTIDWDDETITIVSGFSTNDTISIVIYEIGGGSQLFRQSYTGLDASSSVIVPVTYDEIYEVPVFANGELVTGITWEPYNNSVPWVITETYAKQTIVEDAGTYYRALQTVPPGVLITDADYWLVYVPTLYSRVNFSETFGLNDRVEVVVLGVQIPQRSWSTPLTEVFVANDAIVNTKLVTLTNSLQGTNPANLIVTRNGVRLRPPACIEWIGDGTSLEFGLPQRIGFDQDNINAVTDITVYVDNVIQTQSFGAIVGSYGVTNWTGSNTPGRQVLFNTPPDPGAQILICVSTQAWYNVITGSSQINLIATINIGDVIAVTSWNDTSEQDLVTTLYVGPVVTGITVVEGYDETAFDLATVSNTPGSFDYSTGISIANNNFYLRPGQSANRLWVTVNGYRLLEGQDYSVANDELILASGPVATNDVVVITQFVNDTVPEAIAFRIFQDMRGIQTTFRITSATSTVLTQELTATADIAYVEDANKLSESNLELGYFGVVTINGERILYRNRDVVVNAISGLQRGTAGTGAANHSVGTAVYDMGIGNRMLESDQNYIVSTTSLGNGSATTFTAPDIEQVDFGDSSTIFQESIEVYVGGIRARVGFNVTGIVAGNTYTIASIGNTDWHAIGLDAAEYPYPAPGQVFVATAVGTGTGVVGESLSNNYYTIISENPVTIEFTTANDLPAPADGVEVTILQRRGVNWYQPGDGTASDGRPLQITETTQARFLRGL